jgi:PASTA domain
MVIVASVLSIVAGSASASVSRETNDVQITSAVANPDNTVTVNWTSAADAPNYDYVYWNFRLDVGSFTHWFGNEERKSTSYTTSPLPPGTYNVTLTIDYIFHTNTYFNSSCHVSSSTRWLWICSLLETSSATVTIPAPAPAPAAPPVAPPARPPAPATAPAPAPVAAKVTVGSYIGLREAAAIKANRAIGLRTRVLNRHTGPVKAGFVVAQSPKPGTRLFKGMLVTIYVGRK